MIGLVVTGFTIYTIHVYGYKKSLLWYIMPLVLMFYGLAMRASLFTYLSGYFIGSITLGFILYTVYKIIRKVIKR